MTDIKSYDFHTYWREGDAAEKQFAKDFREKVSQEFAAEIEAGDLRVHKFWDRPVGPHPIHMWELDTADKYDAALFVRVLNFYQANHGDLSVLIHPSTPAGDFIDHTKHALWLGRQQDLVLSILK